KVKTGRTGSEISTACTIATSRNSRGNVKISSNFKWTGIGSSTIVVLAIHSVELNKTTIGEFGISSLHSHWQGSGQQNRGSLAHVTLLLLSLCRTTMVQF